MLCIILDSYGKMVIIINGDDNRFSVYIFEKLKKYVPKQATNML